MIQLWPIQRIQYLNEGVNLYKISNFSSVKPIVPCTYFAVSAYVGETVPL